ncbi:DUF4433 domain-containing protein [Nocardia brasiliensis]|uniref:DarT domain-containing protein n=1 Tax=Nocardia brasiliensis (strain ATCC 700358 / HUJEG-1) TaxID=1133849 RepID=K0EVT8_NOCB7|nr:DUF4433 domain-containing protein [Nocardia brasiliensis]AFT99675.1 hypothetical protein O3I_008565 [Nocardia brasiliensis ATCC 700358]OCF90605.1 hypothetical protein AW168_11695 [Nocardia brasiliensis]
MDLAYIPASGFMSCGGGAPLREHPRDWLAWHFTHAGNLGRIASEKALLPASAVTPKVNVANPGVKQRRAQIVVRPDSEYPACYVNEHVPFYIAAKSPMLYVVNRGHADYSGGSDDLVLLGFVLGNLAVSGSLWCATDQNAATSTVGFSRKLDDLGHFVDFDLLCQRDWYNTPDDQNRMSRRAAEVLVKDRFDLRLVQVVIAKKASALEVAKVAFQDVGGVREYHVVPEMFY